MSARERLRALYERLWDSSIGRVRSGDVELDPVLQARTPDRRRGLTLIARPSRSVRERVATFLQELRRVEPEQYYYTPSEFHVTALSLFTATTEYQKFFAKDKVYVEAVDAALSESSPLRIEFEGVTVSAGTVMIQGFFECETLNELRERLRNALRARGLGGGLDQRYRVVTAHMTVVRFRSRLRDSRRFAALLEGARQRSFGMSTIRSASLVTNDWYMSRRVTRTLKRYPLGRQN